MNIPLNLRERIDAVIGYVGDTTSDYLVVKRQLINNFPTPSRALFSARHPCTKKHILNEFDKAVIWYWQEQTGIRLEVAPEKLHDPEWEHRKKGWALTLLNKERKQRHDEQDQRTPAS
jgi:hypothetical protein